MLAQPRATLAFALSLVFIGLAQAAEKPSWLDPAARLMDQATAAKANRVDASAATAAIIAHGPQSDERYPAFTVQAVTSAYNSCPAFEASVLEAVKILPAATFNIISAVQDLEACPCSADSVWPHTRLDGRIRVESRRFDPIGLGVRSNCVAIAAKIAVEQAPEQAKAILAAASGDFFGRPGVDRNGRRIVDAVGRIGEQRTAWQDALEGKGLSLARDRSECAADRDPSDESNYAQGWASKEGLDLPALGEVDSSCDRRSLDLVLNDYQNNKDDQNAVELFNNTAVDLNLERGRYVLDVYGDGASVPTQTLALKGKLMSGQALVLAGENADKATRERAQVVSDRLDVAKLNALVLRRAEITENDCGNVSLALGMIATGLGADGERFLQDTAKEYEAESDARQIDAIGTVGAQAKAWQGDMAGKPITVQRADSTCEGDGNASDEFKGVAGWAIQGEVKPEQTGSVDARCMANARDLVLSEYQNDAEQYRSVSIFNNTGAMVDLADAGYVLEIYGDGANDPSQTVALKGILKNGAAYTIADEDAPAAVKERANLVSNELSTDKINALVLKRVSATSARRCVAETIAGARDINLPIALVSPFAPSRTPRPEDAIDGTPRGAEVASPN